jgi:hypothetical protein
MKEDRKTESGLRPWLRCLVLRFWPIGTLILEREGWIRFNLRKKKFWWRPYWMTNRNGGTYPYGEAVEIYKQNAQEMRADQKP